MSRLQNEIGTVGLALSGGAVRGAAQIGAIAVLEENSVPIHIVSGTSAGAAVGALYAAGTSTDEMMDFMSQLSWPKTTHFEGWKKLGLFSTNPFRDRLRHAIDDATFADLEKQLVVVACDVLSGDRVLLTEGDVVRAIGASTAIPGLFTPVEHEDRLLIDGGIVDNYPVTAPYEAGAEVVIGIDIGAHPSQHAPSNFVDMLIASMEVRNKSTGVRVADVDIEPDVREFSSFDFDSISEMYERGRQAAEAAMPEIEHLLDA